jgi:hypothetical protein
MSPTLKRYNSIRRADDLDDQQGSSAIANAIVSSGTQEQFQIYVLSRIRQIIFGEVSTEHWYEDFVATGIPSLRGLDTLLTPSEPGSLLYSEDGVSYQSVVPLIGDSILVNDNGEIVFKG